MLEFVLIRKPCDQGQKLFEGGHDICNSKKDGLNSCKGSDSCNASCGYAMPTLALDCFGSRRTKCTHFWSNDTPVLSVLTVSRVAGMKPNRFNV